MKNSTPIQDAIILGQLLEFKEIFPNEQPLTVSEYLSGGSKDIVLNVAASFLGFKSYGSKFNDNQKLLKMIFGIENNSFANEIYSKIKNIEKTGTKIGIINSYNSLKLFEIFFEKETEEKTQSN